METIFCLSLSLHFDSQDSTADTPSEESNVGIKQEEVFLDNISATKKIKKKKSTLPSNPSDSHTGFPTKNPL